MSEVRPEITPQTLLDAEHQRIAEEARERIKQLIARHVMKEESDE